MTKHHPDGVFNLDHFEHEVLECKKDSLCFVIKMKGNDQEFTFKCPSTKDLFIWKGAISSRIHQSQGFEYKRSAEGIESPWKYDNITEE